jgi:hypothetical protein
LLPKHHTGISVKCKERHCTDATKEYFCCVIFSKTLPQKLTQYLSPASEDNAIIDLLKQGDADVAIFMEKKEHHQNSQ